MSRPRWRLPLVNGDQIFPPMLEAIDNAKRRISFENFVYETSEIGNRFTAALERAAQRGVKVYIVLDWIGASSLEDADVERLKKAAGVVTMPELDDAAPAAGDEAASIVVASSANSGSVE